MADLSATIQAKSDQKNAEDLLSGPETIKITDVRGATGDQPIAIHYEGGEGRPFKPCKTMRRLLVMAWGSDGSQYVGRSMTIYNDPTVKWAGKPVGGIRISHLSHIDKDMTVALTVTRGQKKPYTVKPLQVHDGPAASSKPEISDADALSDAKLAAGKGKDAFTEWWNANKGLREVVRPYMDELQGIAANADAGDDAGDEVPFE